MSIESNQKEMEHQLEHLGAFEISEEMLKLAQHNEKNNVVMDAGRGNPNWINTKARLAFARIIEFGVAESRRTILKGDLAGYTTLTDISTRFAQFLDAGDSTDNFLLESLEYVANRFNINRDEFVKEMVDGVIGNNYPVPSRVLKHSEKILNAYLQETLYNGVDLAEQTHVFPTEGGSAAIVYIFNSLRVNHLLAPGDKIAVSTPIFTPYLQIPVLNEYDMVEVDLSSSEEANWEIQPTELAKVSDPDIKALFLVNPSNPGAMALDERALAQIKQLVVNNPDLIIITDDVYGTFVNDFQTVYSVVPNNTLLVYSYSKLFGATGWRVGMIAAHEDNVFDRLISQLPAEQRAELDARYALNVFAPAKMQFIDRIVADSRAVGLYHTAGLSTPQQLMEVLFSLNFLLEANNGDYYVEASKAIVAKRYAALFDSLEIPANISPYNSKYYALIDVYQLAEKRYDVGFRDYLMANFEQLDFLYKLSEKSGVVVMDGAGFGTSEGVIRVSEANLPDEAYSQVAIAILELLADYNNEYLNA
ncbi:bifunctional aspartate transaminase/aspartate 4-decarboxylase [Periweissella fabaria]|uniref:Aminotransferase n=1 Tax=Periweissella fabaria TaxID=546157 RepID=A0ABM8Z5J0_9LACO|nr:bifunctional aspartate transaminase/aspartate 4-decarboxylase [Periweissella fabaria]MCM0597455.1 bifunctional aspartate transaminase/aspartate 4-decarboxylase [Periweissella fabaria]CAH0416040.1 Bifunctional aspartate aminotransferase and L-aspartate beta-decarboxylase [Periweissella fabaria]